MNQKKSLDIRYACIQGLYWSLYCTMIGYASIFLLDEGYNNTIIGIVLSLSSILAVVGQPYIASYMDKTTKLSLRKLISLFLFGIIIFSIIIIFFRQASFLFVGLLVVVFTLMIILQPFINTLTFTFEKHGININFGLARGIGSVAYALMSLTLGNIVREFGPGLLPYFYIGLTLCTLGFVYTFVLPDGKDEITHIGKETQQVTLIQFVRKYKSFMIVFVATVFLFFDHTLINNFFIQIIQHIGGNSADMGNAIFLAAVLELPTMAYFTKIQKKIGCKEMLMISAVFFSIKHIITYFAFNMTMIYIAQFLQMFAYALFIPASVYYVNQTVDKTDMVKGQALITGAMTLSGVFASLIGGMLLDVLGVQKVLLIGAIVSVIGTICLFTNLKNN